MSALPAKEQKTTDAKEPKPPIVFNTPGYQPDVRLGVFDQEFHLNSIPLELHSAFFRKFLDSPDKAAAIEGNASALAGPAAISRARAGGHPEFAYHWVTVIDGEKNVASKASYSCKHEMVVLDTFVNFIESIQPTRN
ncbi:hypothetical protein ACEPPN_017255 [Leptodophora sp. 'Broadleaf-Isolate-01']